MKKKYLRIVTNLLVFIVTVLLIIFVLPKLIVFFMPFVIGWLIAMIANPMVRFLEKKVKIKRKAGSVIIIIVVIAAVVAALYFIGRALVQEAISIIGDAPNILASIQNQLNIITDKLGGVYDKLPEDVQDVVSNLGSSFLTFITNFFNRLGSSEGNAATSLAKGVVDGLLMVIITLISAYFFVADRDELIGYIKKFMPKSIYEKLEMIKQNFSKAFGGYFKAQFKIMIVITIIIFVGLEILRVDYSFIIALIIAFLDLLPVLGTGTVLGPWAVIQIINGEYLFAVGLGIIYIVCQVVKQVLQPKMVGDSIGMNPLLTLFFMFVGYKFGGMLGLILGIPIGMVVVNFYQSGVFDGVISDISTIANDINNLRKRPEDEKPDDKEIDEENKGE